MNFEQSFARGNEEGHAHSKKINNHRTTRVLYFEQSFALSETMHAIRIFNPWFSLKVRNFKSCEKVIARKLLCFPASRVSNRGSRYSTGTSWNSSQASILEVIEYRGSSRVSRRSSWVSRPSKLGSWHEKLGIKEERVETVNLLLNDIVPRVSSISDE